MSAQEAYVLSFRRDDIKEDERLDWQHELIKHLIWGGQLIQASIPLNNLINNHSSNSRIADVGCGTGIWLKEVADIILPSAGNQEAAPPRLVGFDTNPRAFRYESTTPSLQLIEHDCTTPFAAEYIGQFDLVNIRGLAYAIPEGKFPLLIKNVIQLLSKPPSLLLIPGYSITLCVSLLITSCRAWGISPMDRKRGSPVQRLPRDSRNFASKKDNRA